MFSVWCMTILYKLLSICLDEFLAWFFLSLICISSGARSRARSRVWDKARQSLINSPLTTVITIIKTNALISILEDKKGWRYSSVHPRKTNTRLAFASITSCTSLCFSQTLHFHQVQQDAFWVHVCVQRFNSTTVQDLAFISMPEAS